MNATPNMPRRLSLRAIAFTAAVMLPASASAPAFASSNEFAATFAPINVAATAFVPAAGMVDVTAIDPADAPAPAPVSGAAGIGRVIGSGVASYYADKFNGRRTASGEAFSNSALTAAHRSLPFGTKLRVTNPANGRSVVVRVNDRGPFHAGRVLDLSRNAATQLGLVARGSGRVELSLLD